MSSLLSFEVRRLIFDRSHSVNTLQPMFFPGFTFSWVGLISHRLFMPKLLMMKDKEVSFDLPIRFQTEIDFTIC